MSDYPETSASLIARIQDPANGAAWAEFEALYRPVIFRSARTKGLQYADAFDLVQHVLMSVAAAIDKYERQENGPPFRNWLSRVTRNAILKALTRKPHDQAEGGSKILDVLSEVSSPDEEVEAIIQLEYRRELFHRAAGQIRLEVTEPTWLAFEMTVVQGTSIERAASQLKVSVGNIYAARSRVMKRFRDIVFELSEFESI